MRGDASTIKERLGIAEVLSGYVKLQKAGVSFKARCPFHNEKTPSFFVSPLRQSYYCFGCGAKGDIFSFVEEVEGLDFLGALKFLANKAGIELEYRGGDSKTEKDKIGNILEEATKFFEKGLVDNDSARRYVASRSISEESIGDWRIGYAPAEWRSLFSHLESMGYGKDLIIKAGLAKISDEGTHKEPYDVFRDRIIFPLADQNGRIIAFSGRALSKETEPKYLNSPDTPLFTKSETLYGLDRAKEQVRKKDYAVLVEGQIDLVLSHQAGVKNSVAASGTAFTRMHLERLKRFSSR
ncbi:MAG TPA: DNA primase, partial [Candidatus Paceibacterota bacterium]